MAERPTIAFRVDETQKATWKAYAEDHEEYDSLSHLIRVALAHEMSDAYGRLGQGGDSGQAVGKVLERVNQIQGRLDDIEAEVSATREETRQGQTDSVRIMKRIVMDEMPRGRENAVTFEEFTALLEERGWDLDENYLRYALTKLSRDVTAVKESGEEWWVKE